MKFAELNIKDDIKRAIEVAGYVDGTIIQENTIDTIMAGKDVLAQAPTGTGKTAAFVVPTLNKLDFENKNIQVCVLAPTRELVVQIVNEFGKLGRYFQGFNVVGIYGGQEINKQFKQLDNKPQIVVCTPGRLSDHLKRKTISLANVQTLILDEVDEMLSMGFARDVHNIIMQIKVQHQTLMFSATMSRDVMDASKKYQSEPYFYKDPASNVETSANVEQFYIKVNKNKKVDLVTRLIKDNQFFMTIIFVNTKKQAKWLSFQLKDKGFQVDSIHSDLRQNVRDRVMKKFRAGELQILVATDMMARGIDVKNIDGVINYEEPRELDAYVHRIGRTGRAGAKGKAYTLLAFDINEEIRKLTKVSNGKIQEAKVEGFEYDPNDRGTPMGNFGGAFNPDAAKVSTRFFMTLGEMDGLDKDSLKNFIISNSAIKSEDLLDVYVKDKYSFVTLVNSKKDELNNLHDYQGRAFKISEASERQPRAGGFGGGSRGGSRGGYGGGSRGGYGGGRDRRSSGGSGYGGGFGGHRSYDREGGEHSGHERSFGSHGHRSFGGGDRGGYRGKPKGNGSFHKFGNRES